jgi:hypothetical protein
MPSYIYRRQLTSGQQRETLEEVRARLIEELKRRTEDRLEHWNRLGQWCSQRPGRRIKVDWHARAGNNNNNTEVVSAPNHPIGRSSSVSHGDLESSN